MDSMLASARKGFITLDGLFDTLRSAPIGLLDGPIPVLVTAWLIVHADDVAIYQDGTYQPRLTIELIERALKVPERFTLKHVVVTGARRRFLEHLVVALQPRPLTADARNATVLQVVSPLVSVARDLPEFTRTTKAFLSTRAAAVRDSLLDALEPDRLLFSTLPEACDLSALTPRSHAMTPDVVTYCNRLAEALDELESAYPRLLEWVGDRISERTRAPRLEVRANLAARTSLLVGQALNPSLRAFLHTACDPGLDDDDWLEAIAMNVADRPPGSWGDEDVSHFETTLAERIDSFRRLEALYYQTIEPKGDEFEAARITRTEPDGTEQAEVYWVKSSQRQALQEIIDAAQAAARDRFGPQAQDALLAVHAELVMKEPERERIVSDYVGSEQPSAGVL